MNNEFITNHVVHIMSVMLQCDIVDVDNFSETMKMVYDELRKVHDNSYPVDNGDL